MSPLRFFPVFLAALAILLLSGCALLRGPRRDRTDFFTLVPTVGVAAGNQENPALLLRTVEVPAYLQRNKAMAVRQKDGAVRYAGLAWWSEPLDLGFARVLREDLARVGVATVSRLDQEYTGVLQVRILRAEGVLTDDGGRVEFAASYDLRQGDGPRARAVRRTFNFEPRSWDGKDHAALAELLSQAAGELATAIQASLAGG